MTESLPESDRWMSALIQRSALVPDPSLRTHWQRVLPALPTAARYELAAILLEVEHLVPCA